GFAINRTNPRREVNETLDVNGKEIHLRLAADQEFQFFLKDVDIDFGGILEIRGDFTFGGDSFAGQGLEIFVGSGPSLLPDGAENPEAIGVLLTNAEIGVVRLTGGFAVYATGDLALLGLDGMEVSGRATFLVNTTATRVNRVLTFPVGGGSVTVDVPGNSFSFVGAGVEFNIANTLIIGGDLGITRRPNGALDISLNRASVTIQVAGERVFSIGGTAGFSIDPVAGFRLRSFRVNDFLIFPEETEVADLGDGAAPVLFPTADLAKPLAGAKLTRAEFASLGYLDVAFNDPNQVGLRPTSITDTAPEFRVLVDGVEAPGITFQTPTLTDPATNTYRYAFSLSGQFPTDGVVSIEFLAQGFFDNDGNTNFAEVEQFNLAPANGGPLPPTIQISAFNGGDPVTAISLNTKRYIDVTFVAREAGTAIDPDTINGLEFTLTGSAVNAAELGFVAGKPLLVSGTTYRYFLRDNAPTNGIDIFKPGDLVVTVAADAFAITTGNGPVGNRRIVQTYQVADLPPGAQSPRSFGLGPLTLQGPRV
ncbi:MAG: hypothetical protein KDM81_16210, partial [Verrucomicrobiae bacterium]|nr:hypothetical protein [Verrucomicrobiae bacterium]